MTRTAAPPSHVATAANATRAIIRRRDNLTRSPSWPAGKATDLGADRFSQHSNADTSGLRPRRARHEREDLGRDRLGRAPAGLAGFIREADLEIADGAWGQIREPFAIGVQGSRLVVD
jgi:hypothetical protein